MPRRVRAFCQFGVRHSIEVEDQVTAYLEYPNGATGVFIASTCEAPGTNRLEIVGERGKVVAEDSRVTFSRNEVPMTEFSRSAVDGFAAPPVSKVDLDVQGTGGQHAEIIQNFVDAIVSGAPLIARAEEGIRSLELANAMLYSTLVDKTVELPLDSLVFERALKGLIAGSKGRTQGRRDPATERG
jgi:predicted dehydrogenase